MRDIDLVYRELTYGFIDQGTQALEKHRTTLPGPAYAPRA